MGKPTFLMGIYIYILYKSINLSNSRLGDLNLNKHGIWPSTTWEFTVEIDPKQNLGIGHIETFTDLSNNKGEFKHVGTSTIGNLTVKTADSTHPALGFDMI
jgi:hypothetical protein